MPWTCRRDILPSACASSSQRCPEELLLPSPSNRPCSCRLPSRALQDAYGWLARLRSGVVLREQCPHLGRGACNRAGDNLPPTFSLRESLRSPNHRDQTLTLRVLVCSALGLCQLDRS